MGLRVVLSCTWVFFFIISRSSFKLETGLNLNLLLFLGTLRVSYLPFIKFIEILPMGDGVGLGLWLTWNLFIGVGSSEIEIEIYIFFLQWFSCRFMWYEISSSSTLIRLELMNIFLAVIELGLLWWMKELQMLYFIFFNLQNLK